jgi:hypothetical protein
MSPVIFGNVASRHRGLPPQRRRQLCLRASCIPTHRKNTVRETGASQARLYPPGFPDTERTFILEKAVHPRKSLKARKKLNRYKNAERNLQGEWLTQLNLLFNFVSFVIFVDRLRFLGLSGYFDAGKSAGAGHWSPSPSSPTGCGKIAQELSAEHQIRRVKTFSKPAVNSFE